MNRFIRWILLGIVALAVVAAYTLWNQPRPAFAEL